MMGEWNSDFSFGFNDSNFSDRILRIHICTESLESTQSPSVERVIILHINSLILAGRSPFFYKLFSNQMSESHQCEAILQITASEEAAFIELLNFMYSNYLRVTTTSDVLDVLIAANKFDVPSCMIYCGRLLKNLPLTPETVLLYLDLPSTVLSAEEFQPLTVAAKQFYAVHYKDITTFQDEILSLPLSSVEAIISSDDIHAHTEDDVYMFVLKWARVNYPKIEDRHDIIGKHIGKYIRYSYMTYEKLKEILKCDEFAHLFVQKLVNKAISFIRQNSNLMNDRFVENPYKLRLVKMDESEQPHVVAYMNLKHDVCASLFPLGSIRSEAFNMCGQVFYLCVRCHSETINMVQENSFRLYLGIQENVTCSIAFDYVFAVRSKGGEEFVTKRKGTLRYPVTMCTFKLGLFATPWEPFTKKDGDYFIDDVLYLSFKLAVL